MCIPLPIIHWSAFLGAVFLSLSDVLGWSSNGSGVNRQLSTQLEITAQLARELGHQIGYYL